MLEVGIFLGGAVVASVVWVLVRRNNTAKFNAILNEIGAMIDCIDEKL